jgi:hypothetical protein
MILLSSIIQRFEAEFKAQCQSHLLPSQLKVLSTMAHVALQQVLKCWRNAKHVFYSAMIQCAANAGNLHAPGQTVARYTRSGSRVAHAHTRRLEYHPHVHIAIPGGGVHRERREWRKVKGDYLFNGTALAVAFRGAFLNALSQAGLNPDTAPRRNAEKMGGSLQESGSRRASASEFIALSASGIEIARRKHEKHAV